MNIGPSESDLPGASIKKWVNKMMNRILQTGMIIFLILLFACSSQKLTAVDDRGHGVIDEQRELIKKNVQNSDKKVQLLQILDEIEQASQDFFKYYSKHNRKIVQLNQNYNSSRQDFESVIESLLQERKKLQKEVFDGRLKMVQQFQQNEWQQVFLVDSLKNNNEL